MNFVWIAILVCLVYLPCNGFSQVAQPYSASGHLEETAYDQNGLKFSNHHSDFQIDVNGNQWGMVLTQGTGHIIRVGSDGKAVYSVMSFPPQMPLPTGAAPPALVDLGSYYLSGIPYENIVWYALASSRATNNILPAPWLDARTDPTAYAFIAKVNRRLDSGLPAKVQFFVSKTQVQKATTNENLLVESESKVTKHFKAALDAYKDGFLVADYEVFETTNIGAETIPLHFALRQFTPDYSNGKVFVVWEGTVSSVGYSEKTNFTPQDIGIVGITDYRLKNVKDKIDGVRYLSSNQWVSVDNSNLIALYQNKKTKQPQQIQHLFDKKNKIKLPVLIVMAIVFVLPAVFMIKNLRKK